MVNIVSNNPAIESAEPIIVRILDARRAAGASGGALVFWYGREDHLNWQLITPKTQLTTKTAKLVR